MNGCELSKCPYWDCVKCTDKKEYIDDNRNPVCGLRADAISKE